MVDPDRLRVWFARLAAPLAFFFAATVLVILVQRGLESDEGEAGGGTESTQVDTSTTAGPSTQPDGTTTTRDGPCLANRTRVREGETLEAIAERCDVPVDQIIELNGGIDPLALTPGQKVRIRPAGAEPPDATEP